MLTTDYDYLFKLLLIGDSGVGKVGSFVIYSTVVGLLTFVNSPLL